MANKLVRGSLIILIGNVIFRIGGYIYRFLMAILLGPTAYGILGITLPFQGIFQTLSAGGLPPAIAKYVAEYEAVDEKDMARQTIYTALKIMVFLGLFFGALMIFVVAPYLAYGYLEKECGVILHKKAETTEIYGKEFFLAHGDGMGDPNKSFKVIRAIFHNKVCQWLFSALHPRWGISFGLTWAKHSYIKHKESDEPVYLGEEKEHLVLFAKDYIEDHPNIDYFIFGHRHIELDIKLARHTRLMILGDWISQFTYAVFDGEHMFLEEYVEGESQP